MKLERINEYVMITVVTLAGLGFAVACGRLTGEGQVKLIAFIASVAFALTLCIGLRSRIWLLIPLFWELTGQVSLLPLPFAVRDLAVLLAFGSFLAFYALKIVRGKVPFEFLDLVIFANMAYLITVYFRNPVGVRAFGSELVGGRPYFNIAIGCLAYWVMKRAPSVADDTRRLPLFLLFGAAFVTLAGTITEFAPGLAYRLEPFYSGFATLDSESTFGDEGTGRQPMLSAAGNTGIRLLCSYFVPLTLLLPVYPFRFFSNCAFLLMILLSGFRSAFFTVMVYMSMGSYFRKRTQDLFIFAMVGCLTLIFLASANGRLFNLPLSIQRAMSFLPGKWDYQAVDAARGSSQWRFEMWRIVLTEDKWIKDKMLGDGFGFTQHDLALMQGIHSGGRGVAGISSQEQFMIVGAYHSGPLSTIRYVGVVGLILFYILLINLAMRGWRLIRASRGTDYFPVALFIGMPAIFTPFSFTLIAGGFDANMPEALFTAGLLGVLERTLREKVLTGEKKVAIGPRYSVLHQNRLAKAMK